MASAGCASAAGLDTLDVFEVVVSDGGAPGADGGEMSGDFGIGFDAVGFVAWDGEARGWCFAGGVAVEYGGEGFGVGEGVVDAGLVTVLEIVGATVEEIVVGAGGHEFEVALGHFEKLRFVIG